MTSGSKASRRLLAALGTSAVFAMVVTGCAAGGNADSNKPGANTSSGSLIVGTTDKVTTLDQCIPVPDELHPWQR